MVVTMLDEVAWLLNLRGSDIDYNPVFFAYVIVTDDKAVLFVNPAQVDDSVRHSLGDFVQILPYDSFFPYLQGLAAEVQFTKEAVSIVQGKRRESLLTARVQRVSFSVTSQVWLWPKQLAEYVHSSCNFTLTNPPEGFRYDCAVTSSGPEVHQEQRRD